MKTLFRAIFIVLSFLSCSDNIDEKSKELSYSCKDALERIEDCMQISRGSFSYIDSCGEKEVLKILSFDTCVEVKEYISK